MRSRSSRHKAASRKPPRLQLPQLQLPPLPLANLKSRKPPLLPNPLPALLHLSPNHCSPSGRPLGSSVLSPLLLAWLIFFNCHWAQAGEILFVSYNLENYFTSTRSTDYGMRMEAAKSAKAVSAEVKIISQINPDILGVCEMGGPEDFDDFKARLKSLGYVDFEYVNGPDPDRHLALLSKFPIIARNSRESIPYELNGVPEKVKRGFLDVTIRVAPGMELRCIGVHLKSKLATTQGEALIRRHEAHLLREHIARILQESPTTKLMVYGDFNDTKNEPALQEIIGPQGSKQGLKDLWLRDEQGDRWTYYWKQADAYTRIDYLMTSSALFSQVDLKKSKVYRSLDWNEDSDHRPIIASIKTPKS